MTANPLGARRASIRLLRGYLVFALALGAFRLLTGTGSMAVVLSYAGLLLAASVLPSRGGRVAEGFTGWLPLLALPVLYWAVPATAVAREETFDALLQGWDRAIFGTDPARTLAGAAPQYVVGEALHAAYLSYYLIIYGPPLVMYVRGTLAWFDELVLGFTLAMVGCLTMFCLMPVAGPRYEWPAPEGVPDGVFRSIALELLERGSSRGTAFPSSHLAIALSLSLGTMKRDRALGAVALGLTALLGVGAVYGGFHYGADMLAGAAFGITGWWAGGRIARVEPPVGPA